jgi:hypothetical protein
MDETLGKDEIRKTIGNLNVPQELNSLVIPTYIVPLESIAHEGYAIINPNLIVPELDFRFDLLIDVSKHANHPGYNSTPIIDYTNHVKGSADAKFVALPSALDNFQKSHPGNFNRALFFSSNPDDVLYYACVFDNELSVLRSYVRLYIIGEETVGKSNPDLSFMIRSEIGKVHKKYLSQKLR